MSGVDAAEGMIAVAREGSPAVAEEDAGGLAAEGPGPLDAAGSARRARPLSPVGRGGNPLRAFAETGGLEPIEVFDVDSPFEYPDEATALKGLGASAPAIQAMEHSGEAAVIGAYREALAPFRLADGGYKIAATFRCLLAQP